MRPVFEKFEDFVRGKILYEDGGGPKLDGTDLEKLAKQFGKEEIKDTKKDLESIYNKSSEAQEKFLKDLKFALDHKKKLTKEQSEYLEQRRKEMDEYQKSEAAKIAKKIIDPMQAYIGPKLLGKNITNLKGNAHLQSLLKEIGLLNSKTGPIKNGITCYFNGETEKALSSLTGGIYLDFSDSSTKDRLIDYLSSKAIGKMTEDLPERIIKTRDASLKAKNPELKPYIDTGLTLPYYDKQWKEEGALDYKLKLTGDIIKDMYIFNSKKEGGLSDNPKDSSPAGNPCPYEFDAKTGKLNFEGKEYQLAINPHLKDSISSITGTSKSNKWHTSRGSIWPTWKSTAAFLGITKPLDVAKGFFEMTDDNARKVYELTFYNKHVKDKGLETKSSLTNHCIGTAMWASLAHGQKTVENTLKRLNEYGYSSLNDGIAKVGEKFVTELMLLEQIKLYESYKNADTYIKGWTNGMLNFHRYFVPKYADLPRKDKFPGEYAKREGEGENAYANLGGVA